MKKWLVIFILLLTVWIWSFFATKNLSDRVRKITPIVNGDKYADRDVYLPNNLKYDIASENGICPSDNFEFAKGLVSLTFDDGWKEIYLNAIPMLNRYEIKSTQYVNIHDPIENTSKFMTVNDVLNMERIGHEIGSHAIHHKRFTELNNEEIVAELMESRKKLLKMGVKSVNTFAYPYGEYTDYSVKLSRESDYIGVRVAIPGMNDRKTDKFLLYGYQLENWMVFDPYLKRLVDRAVAERKWLVIIFHQVAKPDYQFYTSPQNLKLLISYLIENRVPVMTVRDVIRQCYEKSKRG